MTHKYDVQHISKLLEEYKTSDELRTMREYLKIDRPNEKSKADDTIIESEELILKLRDIKLTLEEADAKRAVHLDRYMEE